MTASATRNPDPPAARLAAALLLAAGICGGGTASADGAGADGAAAYNKVFFETFMTRCLFSAHSGHSYVTEGMVRLDQQAAAPWLAGSPGSVWAPDPALRVLLIVRNRAGCSVVSQTGDVKAIEDTIAHWFDGAGSPFTRDSFERAADGGFTSRYRSNCTGGTLCSVVFSATPPRGAGGVALMATAARVTP